MKFSLFVIALCAIAICVEEVAGAAAVPINNLDGDLSNIEVIIPNVAKSTAEGPVYLAGEPGVLLFVDGYDGDVCRWDEKNQVVERKHWDTFATFVVPHVAGGYVAGIGQEVIHFFWENHLNYTVLAKVDQGKPTRLVDGKADRLGRVFFATMGLEKTPAVPVMEQGSFYSLDTNGEVHSWDSGLHIANSMVFSPDYTTVYLTESVPGIIYAYDYNLEDGSVSNRRVVIYLPHMEHGVVDRVTVDSDGMLWCAYYGGGKITQIDPHREAIIRTIKIDCPTVTCVTFGGNNYDQLIVTSSSYHQDLSVNPHAGSIFRITDAGVRGFAPNVYYGR